MVSPGPGGVFLTATAALHQNTPARIAERAYAIWQEHGRPPGSSLHDWLEAEAELTRSPNYDSTWNGAADPGPSDVFWRTLVQTTTDHITLLQQDGRILFVNQLASGLEPADVIGTSVYQYLTAEHQEPFRQALDGVFRTGQPWSGEVASILTQLNEVRWYATRLGPVCIDGRVIRVTCVSADITNKKRAERLLAVEHAVSRILARSADLAEASPQILQAISVGLGLDGGALWTIDPPAKELRCVDLWYVPAVPDSAFERDARERTFHKGIGLPGRVWAEGRPAWIPDVQVDDNFPRAPIAVAEGWHGAFAFPIRAGEDVLGVLEFFTRSVQPPDDPLLETMSMIGGQISHFIERRDAERRLYERDREFALARKIQLGLLPQSMPVLPGIEFGGAARFVQETGGDYFDFFPLCEPGVGMVIGDASGHGIAAALVIAATRTALRSLALTHCDPGELLPRINRRMAEDLQADVFVTLFLARLDPVARTLSYCSAGHCTGYVLHPDGRVRRTLPSTSIPLGLEPDAEFPFATTIHLRPGESVLLLTDGVLEAMAPNHELFGTARALDVVANHRDEAPTQICESLLTAVEDYCSPHRPLDDATAAIIRLAPDSQPIGDTVEAKRYHSSAPIPACGQGAIRAESG